MGDPAPGPKVKRVTRDTHFESPTGNIHCLVTARVAGCELRDRDWRLPPAPASCDADWDLPILLFELQRPEFTCSTDEPIATNGRPSALDYENGIRNGDMLCVIERRGVTCRNVRSRHGFFLSHASYRFY